MASLTKIKKIKRNRRDRKLLKKRQKHVKKITQKAREDFNRVFESLDSNKNSADT